MSGSMLGEYFYVMPMHDHWEVRVPNKLDVHIYATEAEAVESALCCARAMQRVTGHTILVRVRNPAGSWKQLDSKGQETAITSL